MSNMPKGNVSDSVYPGFKQEILGKFITTKHIAILAENSGVFIDIVRNNCGTDVVFRMREKNSYL